MYLHENPETFKNIITKVSEKSGLSLVVIEKDYYVTMILNAEKYPLGVLKNNLKLLCHFFDF